MVGVQEPPQQGSRPLDPRGGRGTRWRPRAALLPPARRPLVAVCHCQGCGRWSSLTPPPWAAHSSAPARLQLISAQRSLGALGGALLGPALFRARQTIAGNQRRGPKTRARSPCRPPATRFAPLLPAASPGRARTRTASEGDPSSRRALRGAQVGCRMAGAGARSWGAPRCAPLRAPLPAPSACSRTAACARICSCSSNDPPPAAQRSRLQRVRRRTAAAWCTPHAPHAPATRPPGSAAAPPVAAATAAPSSGCQRLPAAWRRS